MPQIIIKERLKESKLVNQYLYMNHPNSLQWRRIRLGPIPDKLLARMYMTMLRWADAIYVEGGVVTIVEAKLRPGPGAVGQLLLYKDLFAQTPEFTAYKNYPVKLMLLTPMVDLSVIEFCSKNDVLYEVFVPSGYDQLTGDWTPTT